MFTFKCNCKADALFSKQHTTEVHVEVQGDIYTVVLYKHHIHEWYLHDTSYF